MTKAFSLIQPTATNVSTGYIMIPAGTKIRVRAGEQHADIVQRRSRIVNTRSIEFFASGRKGVSWKRNGYKASTVLA